ncbi:MAG: MoaD family protein [Treponema sp.]|jgi:molybdopterin synthase sulfur carrier subunit|nr:MoaD family protein [Treponema sp.]
MRVRFFAYIRNFTGCSEADFSHKETAGELARFLCDRYGKNLSLKIFPGGYSKGDEEFGPEIIILVNGRHVCHLQRTKTPLNDDDRVDIFPVVAGG